MQLWCVLVLPVPIRSNRALCFSMLDLHRKALKDAEAALHADPHFIVAYLRKGKPGWLSIKVAV